MRLNLGLDFQPTGARDNSEIQIKGNKISGRSLLSWIMNTQHFLISDINGCIGIIDSKQME